MSFNQTYEQALAARQASDARKRSQPRKQMKRTKMVVRGGRLKAGKKTNEWATVRAKLKIRFEAAGITTCECWRLGSRYKDCRFDNELGFAHRMKRRKITTRKELETVALLSNPCHDAVEVLPAQDMFDTITMIIMQREAQEAADD